LHGTVVKVCKSDREGTVAGTRGNGEVAPIPDLPNLNPRRGTNLTLLHPTGGGVVLGVVEKPYRARGLLAVVRRALATRSDS